MLPCWTTSQTGIKKNCYLEFSLVGNKYIVCTSVAGLHNETVRVWNATTREIEAGPFTGHVFSHVCGILARWPVHHLGLFWWDNSCVECCYQRDSGEPTYWTDGFSRVCGILARWSVHCLIRTWITSAKLHLLKFSLIQVINHLSASKWD